MNEPGIGLGQSESPPARPDLLRLSREQAGLHIAALAAALKVPVKKLEALEDGRYGELPDLTFARALASSACRHLRVDPAPVLAQIPQGQRPVLGATADALNAPFKPSVEASNVSAQSTPGRLVWWLAGALVLAALALYFWPGAGEFSRMIRGQLEAPMESASPVSEIQQVTPGVAEGAQTEEPALPLLMADSTLAAPGATQDEPALIEAAPPAELDPGKLLVIRARNETWVEVVNAAGAVVIQRVLRAGDSVDFTAAPPYRVIVGRADAAEVFVRGRPFDVMPHARNNVARFEVR